MLFRCAVSGLCTFLLLKAWLKIAFGIAEGVIFKEGVQRGKRDCILLGLEMTEYEIRHRVSVFVVNSSAVVEPVAEHVSCGVQKRHSKQLKAENPPRKHPAGHQTLGKKICKRNDQRHGGYRERPIARDRKPLLKAVFPHNYLLCQCEFSTFLSEIDR